MSFASLLNETATIQQQTPTVDDAGGKVEGAITETDIACRIRPLSARERAMSGAEGTDVTHRLYCAAGVTITEADRVVVGATTYQVEFVNRNPAGSKSHHYEVDMREYRRVVTSGALAGVPVVLADTLYLRIDGSNAPQGVGAVIDVGDNSVWATSFASPHNPISCKGVVAESGYDVEVTTESTDRNVNINAGIDFGSINLGVGTAGSLNMQGTPGATEDVVVGAVTLHFLNGIFTGST